MSTFTVTNVVDGDTFDVSPAWSWRGNTGARIRPTGYDAPEMSTFAGLVAKQRLTSLLLNKPVELRSAYDIDRGRLVCDVFLNGHPLHQLMK